MLRFLHKKVIIKRKEDFAMNYLTLTETDKTILESYRQSWTDLQNI